MAYTLAAPCWSRQSVKPPTLQPKSAQTSPVTSSSKVLSACSSFSPARETNRRVPADSAEDWEPGLRFWGGPLTEKGCSMSSITHYCRTVIGIVVSLTVCRLQTSVLADVVVGVGSGASSQVQAFANTGGSPDLAFFAYGPGFSAGVRVACAPISGSPAHDIICGPGPGVPPQVSVFDGQSGALMNAFMAYEPAMTHGVFVAGGDL